MLLASGLLKCWINSNWFEIDLNSIAWVVYIPYGLWKRGLPALAQPHTDKQYLRSWSTNLFAGLRYWSMWGDGLSFGKVTGDLWGSTPGKQKRDSKRELWTNNTPDHDNEPSTGIVPLHPTTLLCPPVASRAWCPYPAAAIVFCISEWVCPPPGFWFTSLLLSLYLIKATEKASAAAASEPANKPASQQGQPGQPAT